MKELRLNGTLYSADAVTEAVSVFAGYANIERTEEGGQHIVRVTADAPGRERRVAGELGNYALGLTIRDRGAAK